MSELLTAARILSEPLAVVGWFMLAALVAAGRLGVSGLLRRLVAAAFGSYLVLCTPLGANLLIGPLEQRAGDPSACGAAAHGIIVVLTGGARRSASRPGDIESLHLASFRRAITAVDAAHAYPRARLIVAGGGEAAASEARIMAELIARLGVPRERLTIETHSGTTREAAPAIARIASDFGARDLTLITSAAHIPRARATLEREGLRVCPWPTDRQYVRPEFPGALLPQLTALQKSTEALHEYIGLALYSVLEFF